MNHSHKKQSRKHGIFAYVLLVVILIVCCLAFCGCKVSAPLPTGSHENSHDNVRTEYRIDTIYRDRWHTEYMRGDTLVIHDSIYRWRIRDVYIHDSIDNSRIDTIYKTVEVEKQGSAFLQRSGIALWIIIALLVVSVIVGIVIKVAK